MRTGRRLPIVAAGLVVVLSTACERPPADHRQTGWRGIGMEEVENPRTRTADSTAVAEALPVAIPPIPAGDPPVPGTWQNVEVLGNLSEAEMARTMAAITNWVSPQQGCNYCHNPADLASEELYTKIVSRQMLRMVKEINRDWNSHVGDAGVTCYTCHAGNPVPQNYWFYGEDTEIFRHYLDRDDVRVQSGYALTSEGDNDISIPETVYTYELMMSVSNALGVGCTYCHQSSRWADWEESPPARVHALRGMRMARMVNLGHMLPLQDVWPAERLGPLGDGPKIQCSTCHNGANIPVYGLLNGEGYPALHLPEAVFPAAGGGAAGPDGDGGGG